MATLADGYAERDAALLMLHAQWQRAPRRRRTVGADKAYDVRDFVELARELGTTPHVTQNLDAARRQRDRRAHDAARRATRRVSTRGRGSNRRSGG